MPFVQAKCPECGGMLAVDDSKKAANCQFCGEAFIVQEAVNNYNTYNVTNNNTTHNYGEGSIVNVYENKSNDFVIEGGVLKKYQGESVDVVIPDGVVEIGDCCFEALKINSVTIPNSVTSIGIWAFKDCTNLTSIKNPGSVTSIGRRAFEGCVQLVFVELPGIKNYDAFRETPFFKNKFKKSVVTLFVTRTCPKCKIASELLEKEGLQFTKLFVEENIDLTKELGLKCAPTLIISGEGCVEKIEDLPAIKELVESL